MSHFEYAIATPSYVGDFYQCQVLCHSIDQFVPTSIAHFLIVDRFDLALFQPLRNSRRFILTVESLMPWWIKRLPLARRWWLSLSSLPIRNWILQQIIKLSLAQFISQDVILFVDSDVAFIRELDIRIFEKEDKVRLFRIPSGGDISSHYKWHRTAGKLLGIPIRDYYGARYIGNVISWRKDNVLKLYARLEEIAHQAWLKTLCRQWHLSEYILYGVFVDQVLQKNSGHFYDDRNICLEYWENQEMSVDTENEFIKKLKPEHITVMISAKSKMDIERYKRLIKTCQQIANIPP